jgi:hypothetical protein
VASLGGEKTAGPSTPLTPGFPWNLVALAHFKGAHAALSSAAWQEIRVRSGRMTILLLELMPLS